MAEYVDPTEIDLNQLVFVTRADLVGRALHDAPAGGEVEVALFDNCDAEPRPPSQRGFKPGPDALTNPMYLRRSLVAALSFGSPSAEITRQHIAEFDKMHEKARKLDEVRLLIHAEEEGRIDCGAAVRQIREVLGL